MRDNSKLDEVIAQCIDFPKLAKELRELSKENPVTVGDIKSSWLYAMVALDLAQYHLSLAILYAECNEKNEGEVTNGK